MYDIVVTEDMSAPDRDAIVRVLRAYGAAQGFRADPKPIGILLRDPSSSETIGGLWGRTSYDWLIIEFLAIPESLRGMRVGAELIARAEKVARERDCVGIWLSTLEFQAPGFYLKLGFEVAGEIEDSPRGRKRFFMRKRLAPATS
jgi:GNAT superfamily N-acetyltransferase